jgi:hypothetical protein
VLETVTRGGARYQRFSFELSPGGSGGYRVPHHAAVFGPTRWTNLYFPNRLIVHGDLIGGPLASVLGAGIRDHDVHTRRRWGFLSHMQYWKMPHGGDAPAHIRVLRDALDLTDSRNVAAAAVTD